MMTLTVSELDNASATALEGRLDGPARAELSRNITAHVLFATEHLKTVERRVDDDLFRKDVAYALPDETLALVQTLVKVALECFMKGPLTGVPELVGLLMRYERLKVKISGEEAAVLRVLKKAKVDGDGALPIADIRERLNQWGAVVPNVPAILRQLKGKNTDKVTLVREVDGRWSTSV